jgi:uncharacterized ubiquitin-like protein YukD
MSAIKTLTVEEMERLKEIMVDVHEYLGDACDSNVDDMLTVVALIQTMYEDEISIITNRDEMI